jgi:hypothetical protein
LIHRVYITHLYYSNNPHIRQEQATTAPAASATMAGVAGN